MRILIVIILMLLTALAHGQTHTMPGSNVVPSGASLTINSGASITAAAGSTVTGFGSGGGGAPTTATYVTQTPDGTLSAELALSTLSTGLLKSTTSTGALTTITDSSTNWNTAFTQTRQWDGGSTGLTAATGRTSLGATTVGSNIFTLTNPSAVSWLEISALNAVTAVSAATMRTDLSLVPGTNVEVPLTFSTGLTRTTNTVTVNTSQNIATLSNLTTNGFVKTGGAVGTLSVDTATYQASSANLTTWAGIAPGTNVGTFLATPSSANLRLALTDENGTGAALFSGATTPDFTTGFTIGAAAGSGKVMKGNGTNFVPSTETYAVPGTSGNLLTSDGTNWTSAAPVVTAANTLTFTNKRVTPRVTSTASATTWAPSADTDDVYEITGQTAPVTTISNPAGTPVDGQSLIIRFSDNGTARALSWTGSQWQAGPGLALPTSTIVGNHDYVGFKWNSTTSKWTMVASTQLNGTVDDTAYGSSWNGVTGISNSKNAIYDELHLIDTADNGTIVNAGTGFTVTGAAPINYELTGNGTNFISKASDIPNGSSAQQTGFSANTYLAGSVITISAGDFKVGSTYRCMFDMTKTTAGTAAPVITIYIGTAGSTADTAAQTITFAAATGVADTGMFEVWVNFRAVGASATISSVGRCVHNLAITGLTSTGASGSGTVSNTTSSTFNSTAMTKIGVAFNGGASYVGTNNIVQAYYSNP